MTARATRIAIAAGAAALLLTPLAGAVAPIVTITSGPSGLVASSSASFSFSVDDPAATVACRLDGGSVGCGSTYTVADGSHTFVVEATNAAAETGSDSQSWTADATPPTLSGVPGAQTAAATSAAGATVGYSLPTASDTVDASPTVGCSPGPGATFPIGATTVTCTATDDAGHTASQSFTVTVQDTTPPVLSVPGNLAAEATSPSGAAVSFSATATDWSSVSVSCTRASGSTFPLGATTVGCTATDAGGNTDTGSFTVTVRDTTAPTLSVPGPVTAEATSAAGTTVSYSGLSASDAADASPAISCTPASGSTFPVGSTAVTCTATDDAGNATNRGFTVTVRDTTAPVLTTPGSLVVEANGPKGAPVSFTVTASDLGAALLPNAISCSPASGSLFPLGSTTVACSASDAAGNSGTASFPVTVRDTTPPTLVVADLTVTATSAAGIRREDRAMAAYLRSIRATDIVSVSVVVITDAPDLFPVGVTPLRIRAVDGAGNSVSRTVKVTVLPPGRPAPPPPDLTPPSDVTRVRAAAGDHRVTLSWRNPATDFAAAEVRMSVASNVSGERVVYRGREQQAVVRGLRNGVQYRFVTVAMDESGNRSRGIVTVATPRALLLAAPKAGARLAAPPLLRWVRVTGASYFNVQVYRGKKKVLSAWPLAARLQLRRTWSYDGAVHRLTPGTYTWYVWPGLGARKEARYGPMLGKSTFVVTKPKAG